MIIRKENCNAFRSQDLEWFGGETSFDAGLILETGIEFDCSHFSILNAL